MKEVPPKKHSVHSQLKNKKRIPSEHSWHIQLKELQKTKTTHTTFLETQIKVTQ